MTESLPEGNMLKCHILTFVHPGLFRFIGNNAPGKSRAFITIKPHKY